MLRNTYIRLTQYEVPENVTTAHLNLLVLVCKPIHCFEGTLLEDVCIQRAIKLQTDYYDGVASRQRLGSSRVVRLESGYALTKRSLFQFLRVPPYSRDAVLL